MLRSNRRREAQHDLRFSTPTFLLLRLYPRFCQNHLDPRDQDPFLLFQFRVNNQAHNTPNRRSLLRPQPSHSPHQLPVLHKHQFNRSLRRFSTNQWLKSNLSSLSHLHPGHNRKQYRNLSPSQIQDPKHSCSLNLNPNHARELVQILRPLNVPSKLQSLSTTLRGLVFSPLLFTSPLCRACLQSPHYANLSEGQGRTDSREAVCLKHRPQLPTQFARAPDG